MLAAAGGDDAGEGFVPPGPFGPHSENRLYGLSYVQEDDGDGTRLRGASFLWSSWNETVDLSGGLGFWLSAQGGDSQTVIGAGVEITLVPWLPRAPFRFGPRFRLGAEHRRRDPDDGFGGIVALGLEGAVWIGRRLQIALTVDRELNFPADDRTQFGLAFRVARPRY